MQAEVRVAVINVDITHSPSEPGRAAARKVVQQVVAGRSILTGSGLTLVYVHTTVISCVAGRTEAGGSVPVVVLQ